MNAVNDLREVLLLVKVRQLEDESLNPMSVSETSIVSP